MRPKAVIIYGPPGSGKGTQSELLVRINNFINFDSGRYLEKELHSPQANKNPILKKEKKLFDSGKLNSPSFVLKIVKRETNKLATLKENIVYSGSPRTLYEAFGNKKNKGLIQLLTQIFGKKNIYIIFLKVPPKVSIQRNSARRVCSICGLQALSNSKNSTCSLCGGKLTKRILDKPEIIKIRIKEFEKRTLPIIQELKKSKFKIYEINGLLKPFHIYEQIKKILQLK